MTGSWVQRQSGAYAGTFGVAILTSSASTALNGATASWDNLRVNSGSSINWNGTGNWTPIYGNHHNGSIWTDSILKRHDGAGYEYVGNI
jgi:hypothetical protein